jgi:hypothetical protein
MADKDLLVKEKVDHSGIFSFSGLYSFAHSWLKDKEDYGVIEDKYTEKVSGDKRDIRIEWTATKKLGDYFKIEIKLEFNAIEMTDVEVEIDGQKKKMNKGKVTVEVKGALIKDYSSKWEEKPFNKFLREVYNKYIIPQRVEGLEDKVRADTKMLKDDMKAFLDTTGRR